MKELINELEVELNKLGADWNLFGMVDKLKSIVAKMKRGAKAPDGYIVLEAGQSPVHCLWFCHIVSTEDLMNKVEQPRHFFSEEKDSFEEAFLNCCDQEWLSRVVRSGLS